MSKSKCCESIEYGVAMAKWMVACYAVSIPIVVVLKTAMDKLDALIDNPDEDI